MADPPNSRGKGFNFSFGGITHESVRAVETVLIYLLMGIKYIVYDLFQESDVAIAIIFGTIALTGALLLCYLSIVVLEKITAFVMFFVRIAFDIIRVVYSVLYYTFYVVYRIISFISPATGTRLVQFTGWMTRIVVYAVRKSLGLISLPAILIFNQIVFSTVYCTRRALYFFGDLIVLVQLFFRNKKIHPETFLYYPDGLKLSAKIAEESKEGKIPASTISTSTEDLLVYSYSDQFGRSIDPDAAHSVHSADRNGPTYYEFLDRDAMNAFLAEVYKAENNPVSANKKELDSCESTSQRNRHNTSKKPTQESTKKSESSPPSKNTTAKSQESTPQSEKRNPESIVVNTPAEDLPNNSTEQGHQSAWSKKSISLDNEELKKDSDLADKSADHVNSPASNAKSKQSSAHGNLLISLSLGVPLIFLGFLF